MKGNEEKRATPTVRPHLTTRKEQKGSTYHTSRPSVLHKEKMDLRWERDQKNPRRLKQGPENPYYLGISTIPTILLTIVMINRTAK